jgi:hypothetical protein
LVTYTQAVAAVIVVATMGLVATVCSLPALQRRPLAALPVVSLICTAYLWEPGAKMLANGFANFWLAAAATSCAIVLALGLKRRSSLVGVAATSGALLCAVNCWAPLVILAMPACLILCQVTLAAIRSTDRRRQGTVFAAILIAAGMCALKTLLSLINSVSLQTVVAAEGGIYRTSAVPLLVLLGACTLLCLAMPHIPRRMGHRRGAQLDHAMDSPRLFCLTPLIGAAVLSALLFAQLRMVGTSSYYFLKYFIGLELVLAVLTVTVLTLLLVAPPWAPGRHIALVLSCVAAATATQFFGHVSWRDAPMLGEFAANSVTHGTTPSRRDIASDIVSASSSTNSAKALGQVYFMMGKDRGPSGLLPAIWFQAISLSLTTNTAARLAPLDTRFRDRADAAMVARDLLTANRELSVVVAPRYLESLRHMLPSGLRPRVSSWDVVAVGSGHAVGDPAKLAIP